MRVAAAVTETSADATVARAMACKDLEAADVEVGLQIDDEEVEGAGVRADPPAVVSHRN